MSIDPAIMSVLAEEYLDRRLAIFLGAGSSVGSGLPTADDIFGFVRTELGLPPLSDDRDPHTSNPYIANKLYASKRSLSYLQYKVAERLHQLLQSASPGPIHEELAKMYGVDYFFTTNYDDLLESAFRSAGRDFAIPVSRDEDVKFLPLPSSPRARIIKLHGSLSSPSDLILSYDQIKNYSIDHPALYDIFSQILREYTSLFIGTSYRDDTIEEMYNRAINDQKSRTGKGYILLHSDMKNKESVFREVFGLEPIFVEDFSEIPEFLANIRNKAKGPVFYRNIMNGGSEELKGLLSDQELQCVKEIEAIVRNKSASISFDLLKQKLEEYINKGWMPDTFPWAFFRFYLALAETQAIWAADKNESLNSSALGFNDEDYIKKAEEILKSSTLPNEFREEADERLIITRAILFHYDKKQDEAIELLRTLESKRSLRVLVQILSVCSRDSEVLDILEDHEELFTPDKNVDDHTRWVANIIPALLNSDKMKYLESAFDAAERIIRIEEYNNPEIRDEWVLRNAGRAFQIMSSRTLRRFSDAHNILFPICFDIFPLNADLQAVEKSLLAFYMSVEASCKKGHFEQAADTMTLAEASFTFPDESTDVGKRFLTLREKFESLKAQYPQLGQSSPTTDAAGADDNTESDSKISFRDWFKENVLRDPMAIHELRLRVKHNELDHADISDITSFLRDIITPGGELAKRNALTTFRIVAFMVELIELHGVVKDKEEMEKTEKAIDSIQLPAKYSLYKYYLKSLFYRKTGSLQKAINLLREAIQEKDIPAALTLHILSDALMESAQLLGNNEQSKSVLSEAAGYSEKLVSILVNERAFFASRPFETSLQIHFFLQDSDSFLRNLRLYADEYGVTIHLQIRYLMAAQMRLSQADTQGAIQEYDGFFKMSGGDNSENGKGKGIKSFKGNIHFLCQFIELNLRFGSKERALELAKKAVELAKINTDDFPDTPEIHVAAARAHLENGNKQNAWNTIFEASKKFNDSMVVYEQAFFIGMQTGHSKEAMKEIAPKFHEGGLFYGRSKAVQMKKIVGDDISELKEMVESSKERVDFFMKKYETMELSGMMCAFGLQRSLYTFLEHRRYQGGVHCAPWFMADSHERQLPMEVPREIVIDYSAILTFHALHKEKFYERLASIFDKIYVPTSFFELLSREENEFVFHGKLERYEAQKAILDCEKSGWIKTFPSKGEENPEQSLHRFAEEEDIFLLEEYIGLGKSLNDKRKRIGMELLARLIRQQAKTIPESKVLEIASVATLVVPPGVDLSPLRATGRKISAQAQTLEILAEFGVLNEVVKYFNREIYVPEAEIARINYEARSREYQDKSLENIRYIFATIRNDCDRSDGLFRKVEISGEELNNYGYKKFIVNANEQSRQNDSDDSLFHILVFRCFLEIYIAAAKTGAPILVDDANTFYLNFPGSISAKLNTYELLRILRTRAERGSSEYDDLLHETKRLVEWGYKHLPYDHRLMSLCLQQKGEYNEGHPATKLMDQYREKVFNSTSMNNNEQKRVLFSEILLPFNDFLWNSFLILYEGADENRDAMGKYLFENLFMKLTDSSSDAVVNSTNMLRALLLRINSIEWQGRLDNQEKRREFTTWLRTIVESSGTNVDFDEACVWLVRDMLNRDIFNIAKQYVPEFDQMPNAEKKFKSVYIENFLGLLPSVTMTKIAGNRELIEEIERNIDLILEEATNYVFEPEEGQRILIQITERERDEKIKKAIHRYLLSGEKKVKDGRFVTEFITKESDSVVPIFRFNVQLDEEREALLSAGPVNIVMFISNENKEIRKAAWGIVRKKIEILISRDELNKVILKQWNILSTNLLSPEESIWRTSALEIEYFIMGTKSLYFDIINDYLFGGSPSDLLRFLGNITPNAIIEWLVQETVTKKNDLFRSKFNSINIDSELDRAEARISAKSLKAIEDGMGAAKCLDIAQSLMYSPYNPENNIMIDVFNRIFDRVLLYSNQIEKPELFVGMIEQLLPRQFGGVYWSNFITNLFRFVEGKNYHDSFDAEIIQASEKSWSLLLRIINALFGVEPFPVKEDSYDKVYNNINSRLHNYLADALRESWLKNYPETGFEAIHRLAAMAAGMISSRIIRYTAKADRLKTSKEQKNFLDEFINKAHLLVHNLNPFQVYVQNERDFDAPRPLFPGHVSIYPARVVSSIKSPGYFAKRFFSDSLRNRVYAIAGDFKMLDALTGSYYRKSPLDKHLQREDIHIHQAILNFYINGLGDAWIFMRKKESDEWNELRYGNNDNFLQTTLMALKSKDREEILKNILSILFRHSSTGDDIVLDRVASILGAKETIEILDSGSHKNQDELLGCYYETLGFLCAKHGESGTSGEKLQRLLINPENVSRFSDSRFEIWLLELLLISNYCEEATQFIVEMIENECIMPEKRTLIEKLVGKAYHNGISMPDSLSALIFKRRLSGQNHP